MSEQEKRAALLRYRASLTQQSVPEHSGVEKAVEELAKRLEAMQGRQANGEPHTRGWLQGEAHEIAKEVRRLPAAIQPFLAQPQQQHGEVEEDAERKPIIEPGEEFEAATKVIGPEINDPAGFAAADLLHRVLDAVEAVRYRDVKPRPIVDRPEA